MRPTVFAVDVDLSTYAVSAYANPSITLNIPDLAIYSSLTIDFPAGWRFAHDDQFEQEIGPNPNDEEYIGSGTQTAAWASLWCGSSTESLTWTWEEDMTGAPAGSVAHYTVANSRGFDTQAWLVEENDANNDYKIVVAFDEAHVCRNSLQPGAAAVVANLLGTTFGGRYVARNPGISGCYQVTLSFSDSDDVVHTGFDHVPIGTGVC